MRSKQLQQVSMRPTVPMGNLSIPWSAHAVAVATPCWPACGPSWPAGIVFGLAAFTDQLDGYLARRWRVESQFGKVADPLADRKGNRIGHGAGFYDRTFAGLIGDRSSGPLLIGLCHDLQVVGSLAARAWDVPLDILVTEVGVIRPSA